MKKGYSMHGGLILGNYASNALLKCERTLCEPGCNADGGFS